MITLDQKKKFIALMEDSWQSAVGQGGVNVNKAVLFAQAAHESAWGTSGLFLQANNIFGIKATSTWKGEVLTLTGYEWDGTKNVYSPMNWRKYPTLALCMINYSQILNLNSCYANAVKNINSADGFIAGVAHGGWATDPQYIVSVTNIGKEIESLGGPKWA